MAIAAVRGAVGSGPVRRIADVVGSCVLLVLAAPILALAALLVLIGSGRPVLFGHRRLGMHGRLYYCLKFRTMSVDAESRLDAEPKLKRLYVENGFKLPTSEDPRVTSVGQWLRRTYIDELPQLFNVLGGTMSLVGPRPIVEEELFHFGPAAEELLSLKPGIFGEWTSRGRARPAYPERALLELEYIRDRTLARDLLILARSLHVVLQGQADA